MSGHSGVARGLSGAAAGRLRAIALVWLGVAVAGFAVLAGTLGVPRAPEGPPLGPDTQVRLQLVLLGVIAIGGLVAWRLRGIGGAIVVLGAVALGILAAVQYHPAAALLVCLAFLVPGVLLLVAWPRVRGRRAEAALASRPVGQPGRHLPGRPGGGPDRDGGACRAGVAHAARRGAALPVGGAP